MGLSNEEVLAQSKAAFSQWEDTWRKHSKINGNINREKGIPMKDLLFSGIGKQLVCVALGSSLEKEIETLKKYNRDTTDIICVDKAMGALIDNGIKPDYVLICDAGIDYDKWCKPYIDDTKDITLLANVNGNVEWTQNWKGGISYFVNKDNIESEKIFSEISGVQAMIPAGSNVGNSLIIYSTHVFKYDEYLLLGYDFAWGFEDNYYAFSDNDKRYWMKHLNVIDKKGDLVNSSNNLYFSMRWLMDFYNKVCFIHNVKVFNCSGGILGVVPTAKLEKKLKRFKKREITQKEKQVIFQSKIKEEIINQENGGGQRFNQMLSDYNVVDVTVRYTDKEDAKCLN
jgi:hypothetical protein